MTPAAAQESPENTNVRVEATSRNPANRYDRSVMDLNAFDLLLLVLPIGVWALVEAFIFAAQFHWQVAISMVRVVEMPEPVCEDAT